MLEAMMMGSYCACGLAAKQHVVVIVVASVVVVMAKTLLHGYGFLLLRMDVLRPNVVHTTDDAPTSCYGRWNLVYILLSS